MDALNAIQIDDDTRVAVYYSDLMHEAPTSWYGDAVVFHWLDNGDTSDNANDADAVAIRGSMPHDATPSEVFDALRKHYGRAGFETGYMHTSARDYRPAFLAVKPGYGTPKALAEEMNAFFSGDVYSLAVEKRIPWRAPDGRTRYEWESADAISDCYIDPFDDAEVLALALDNFEF